jgi:hypothetical protein
VVGAYGTIPGGQNNIAATFCFAVGQRAKATNQGCFVWGDSTDADIGSSTNNEFTVRASGGVRLFSQSDASIGVQLAPGSGTWSSVSDRAAKTNVVAVDGREILDRLAGIPVSTWSYKSQDASVRHIGPMAQDFAAAFGVGEDDRHITTVDEGGVALAAIQGLNRRLADSIQKKEAEIEELKNRISALEKMVNTLAGRGTSVSSLS